MHLRQTSSLHYIPGLDGMRAIAILLVVCHHYGSPFIPHQDTGLFMTLIAGLVKLGQLGVDLFFVISGFLIALKLMREPVRSWSGWCHFVYARAWRLLPAYWGCLLVFSISALIWVPDSKVLANVWSAWSMTSNLQAALISRSALLDTHFALIHLWSLAVEWHFYLILPILLWALKLVRLTGWLLMLLALLTRSVWVSAGVSDNTVYAFTLCRMDAFACGVLLAYWVEQGLTARPSLRKVRLIGLLGWGLLLGLSVGVAAADLPFKKIVWVQRYGYTAFAWAFAMLLYPLLTGHAKALQLWLERPALRDIGRASYSIYLWHLLFFPVITRWVLNLHLSPLLTLALVILGNGLWTALASFISYLYLEIYPYQWFKQHALKYSRL